MRRLILVALALLAIPSSAQAAASWSAGDPSAPHEHCLYWWKGFAPGGGSGSVVWVQEQRCTPRRRKRCQSYRVPVRVGPIRGPWHTEWVRETICGNTVTLP